ncbi:S100P-binding protein isoform X3 [Strigops habroptila]|uniref:S100P-binding protein isoform X3 n=1 Tax=Strigops habroptila TaxID=2489341 RepID=UPI0011CF705E|nr:S100P-binding protein isoform X3 [Strigops habroptila]
MDNHSPYSPHPSGFCLCHDFKPTVDSTVPRAKRLLDSSEQVQALRSAKKACVLGHDCSTPDPARKLLLCSPGPACFQGSPCFLDDADHDNLVASSSASKYDDVAISVDTTRCFDDSEPDDALLELSDSEEGSSPFNFTEEEIQEILADDCVECEQHLTRKRALSQNVNGESEKDESSRCIGASATTEGVTTEDPNEPLSRECSSVGSEGYPSLLNESAGLDENLLPSAQVIRMLFDLDIQELLNLSPIDADVGELLEDSSLEGAEREASEAISNDNTAHSCDLEGSLEGLVSNGWQSLRKTPFTSSHVPDFRGDGVARCVPSANHNPAEEGSVPLVLMCSTPSSGCKSQELPKATRSCFSGKLGFPEGDEGDSTEAEQPSNSMKSGGTAGGQTEQEETTSGKKPGKVIPVPQEEEESLKQWTCILEAELEQKTHLYPECAHPYEESCSSCTSLIQEPSTAEGERKVFVKSRDPSWAEPQSCIPLGPFWQEQVRAASAQQGGMSDEDYP